MDAASTGASERLKDKVVSQRQALSGKVTDWGTPGVHRPFAAGQRRGADCDFLTP